MIAAILKWFAGVGVLRWIEETDFATWLREGDIYEPFSTYYTLLGIHSIGMAIVVGVCVMLSARLLGFQRNLSLASSDDLMRLAWWGFYINLASGILLYIAQPRRELMTLVYWFKMIAIVFAVITMSAIQKALEKVEVVPNPDGSGTMVEVIPVRARNAADRKSTRLNSSHT